MKIIIKESNYDAILNKLWDKHGGMLDYDLFNMMGLPTMDDIGVKLIKWRGIEETKKLIKDLTSPNLIYTIDDCGTYDFTFTVRPLYDVSITQSSANLLVSVFIFKETAKVTIDDVTIDLYYAIKDDDYGWEVNSEVQDCLHDKLYEIITKKTGIDVEVVSIRFKLKNTNGK